MPCKIHQVFTLPARYVPPMSGNAAESDTRWQRLTVSTVEIFIRDLKDAVWEAKGSSAGKGTMVSLYGEWCDNLSIFFLVRLSAPRFGLGLRS